MARATQERLERALGGADKLRQLTKTDDLASTAAQDFIDDVLDAAYAEINSYIGMAVDLADPALATAPMLVRYEVSVAAYLAWMKGAGGLAIPEEISGEYERIVGELRLIGDRKKGLGLVSRPTTSQQIEQVTKDDTEEYFNPAGPRRRFDGWS